MTLYDISFTTRSLVKRLDKRGNVISETRIDTPITLTALPHATAMSYSTCDDFEITGHEITTLKRYASKGAGRVDGVGNGTKSRGTARRHDEDARPSHAAVAKSSVTNAAATGDMSAAIND